jgi:hypothetical protein
MNIVNLRGEIYKLTSKPRDGEEYDEENDDDYEEYRPYDFERLDYPIVVTPSGLNKFAITTEGTLLNFNSGLEFKFSSRSKINVKFAKFMEWNSKLLILDENKTLWICDVRVVEKKQKFNSIGRLLTRVDTEVDAICGTVREGRFYIKRNSAYLLENMSKKSKEDSEEDSEEGSYGLVRIIKSRKLKSKFIQVINHIPVTEYGILVFDDDFKPQYIDEPNSKLVGCAIQYYEDTCIQTYYEVNGRLIQKFIYLYEDDKPMVVYHNNPILDFMHRRSPWIAVHTLHYNAVLVSQTGLVVQVDEKGDVLHTQIPKEIFKPNRSTKNARKVGN